MEEWRTIPDSTMEISSHGNIRRIGGTNFKIPTDGGGYCIYPIYYNTGRKTKRLHRLVGEIFIPNPDNLPQLDHINGIRNDNRVENLRWCSRSQNQHNKALQKNNSSGFKGVLMHKGRWQATIWNNGRAIHIGVFSTAEEAFEAYKRKAEELHGRFMCPGVRE